MKVSRPIIDISISLFLLILVLVSCAKDSNPINNNSNIPQTLHWELKSSPSITSDLCGVAYGLNTYVAVGNNGIIITSPTADTWTERVSGTNEMLSSVVYGNNIFVCVGGDGTILTSPDAITWTRRVSPTITFLSKVIFNNGLFIVVGASGTILTSSDGINWSIQNTPVTVNLHSIVYGNNLYFAVGDNLTIIKSIDAINWEPTFLTNNQASLPLNTICFGDTLFAAFGKNSANFRSNDFSIRFEFTLFVKKIDFYASSFGSDMFVIVGDWGHIITSLNGKSWYENDYYTTGCLFSITYFKNQFVAVGTNGLIINAKTK